MAKNINLNEIAEMVTTRHGARMKRSHKKDFREFISKTATAMGYDSRIENNVIAKNIVIGHPETAEIVLTAHYDTPPNMPYHFLKKQVATFGIALPAALGIGVALTRYAIDSHNRELLDFMLNSIQTSTYMLDGIAALSLGVGLYSFGILGGENKHNYDDNSSGIITLLALMNYYRNLPENERNKIAFVMFDNEEKGLIGSLCYASKHQIKNQNFLNFDCVGRGNQINCIYTGKVANEFTNDIYETLGSLASQGYTPRLKKSTIHTMSDHLPFMRSKGSLTILCDKKDSPVTEHIHSSKDTEISLETVSEIAKCSAETLNSLLGFNNENLASCLNENDLVLTGTLSALQR